MQSNDDSPLKVSDATLPYSTDDEDVLRLIEAIKRKPDNEKAIREIYNKSNFETSRKALETLGILNNQFEFSSIGKELAIEKDEERRKMLFLNFFLQYPPYGHFLESIAHMGELTVTETENIKDYWWKHNYGASGNNRADGVVAFGKLLQLAGLGKFITGRRGKPSRIEWSPDAKDIIDSASSSNSEELFLKVQSESTSSLQNDEANNVFIEGTDVTDPELSNSNPKAQTTEKFESKPSLVNTTLNVIPNIAINVDMSEWSEDKIITFFKAAYGRFNDERETVVSDSSSQSVGEFGDGYSDS